MAHKKTHGETTEMAQAESTPATVLLIARLLARQAARETLTTNHIEPNVADTAPVTPVPDASR